MIAAVSPRVTFAWASPRHCRVSKSQDLNVAACPDPGSNIPKLDLFGRTFGGFAEVAEW